MTEGSVGRFLTEMPQGPQVEHADDVRFGDNDVRQEAAIRSLLAMRQHGWPEAGDDGSFASAVDVMDAETGFAKIALKWAYSEQRRALHGRSRHGSNLSRTVRLDDGSERDVSPLFSDAEREAQGALLDEAASEALSELESSLSGELRRLYEADETVAHAIQLMSVAQRMKSLNLPYPDSLRGALKRLRAETGLALNVGML